MCSEKFETNKREDRRVSRTRRQLREAFFDLILEKGYEAVTVEDITRRADLGRTTFYLHFKDKEDLLLQSIDEIADELKAKIQHVIQTQMNENEKLSPSISSSQGPLLMLFQHAAANAVLYRSILRGEGTSWALVRIREIIQSSALEFLTAYLGNNSLPVPLEVVANHFAASLLGMITWWLEHEMPYPAVEMVEMYRRMFFDGADRLGKQPPAYS
jgi:AcrR family transcriptional regulator